MKTNLGYKTHPWSLIFNLLLQDMYECLRVDESKVWKITYIHIIIIARIPDERTVLQVFVARKKHTLQHDFHCITEQVKQKQFRTIGRW